MVEQVIEPQEPEDDLPELAEGSDDEDESDDEIPGLADSSDDESECSTERQEFDNDSEDQCEHDDDEDDDGFAFSIPSGLVFSSEIDEPESEQAVFEGIEPITEEQDPAERAGVRVSVVEKSEEPRVVPAGAGSTVEVLGTFMAAALVIASLKPTTVSLLNTLGRGLVVLDTGSKCSVIRDAELVTGVRRADNILLVSGVGEGRVECSESGDLRGYGEVHHNPDFVGNVLGFRRVRDFVREAGGKIVYNFAKDIFTVWHDGSGQRRDVFLPVDGHYVCDMREGPSGGVSWEDPDEEAPELVPLDHLSTLYILSLITTVRDKLAGYTRREVDRAIVAAKLFRSLHDPPPPALIRMLKTGRLLNCPVTSEDVRRAVDIWGQEEALQGRTVRHPEARLSKEYLDEFVDKDGVHLFVDIFFFCGLAFVVSIGRKIYYAMADYIPDKSEKTLKAILLRQIARWRAKKFTVSAIEIVSESGVKSLQPFIEGELKMEYVQHPKGTKVPEVERFGRGMKERVRSTMARVSKVMNICAVLMLYLVLSCVQSINSFPKTGGAIDAIPREEFDGFKLDWQRNLRFEFGDYVQVHAKVSDQESGRVDVQRTFGGIALRSLNDEYGTWEFLKLNTWTVVKRVTATVLPMPEEVIQMLNARAASERDSKRFLKLEIKRGLGVEIDDGDFFVQDDFVSVEVAPEAKSQASALELPAPSADDVEQLYTPAVGDDPRVDADPIESGQELEALDEVDTPGNTEASVTESWDATDRFEQHTDEYPGDPGVDLTDPGDAGEAPTDGTPEYAGVESVVSDRSPTRVSTRVRRSTRTDDHEWPDQVRKTRGPGPR